MRTAYEKNLDKKDRLLIDFLNYHIFQFRINNMPKHY